MGLYDDINENGGLVASLQAALREIGSPLGVSDVDLPSEIGKGFPAYARVENGKRFSQVYMAAEKRLFLIDFWDRGVSLANAKTSQLLEGAKAIHAWNLEGANIAQMAKSFSFFLAGRDAQIWEEGREVEARWKGLLSEANNPEGFPPSRELKVVLEVASKNPILRGLFPFTSLYTLCFSRCTGYPYTRDCPMVTPLGANRFRVATLRDGSLGEGNAVEAIDIVLRNLPPNCGPAVKGTADDLGKS